MPVNNCIKRSIEMVESDPSRVLDLRVGNNAVTTGCYIPKAEATSAPEISFHGASLNKTYMIVALDIDAPFPAFSVLGPILHWIQPGLRLTGTTLTSNEPFVANFIGPAPPPFGGPHRYVFFLYEQPATFVASKYAPPGGKTLGNGGRMRYDLDTFEKVEKLGPAIACNYFKSN